MFGDLTSAEKLYVEPYIDAAFTRKAPGDKFSALINPATYTCKYEFEYDDTQAGGKSSVQLKFNKIKPQKFTFDFLFDSTGVVKNASVLNISVANPFAKPVSVAEQIEDFKKKIIEFKGTTHRPYYLKIHWGTLLFKGVLNQIDIEYKVFTTDGTPIRAVAKCSFTESIEDDLREALENKQSPDITHERIFTGAERIDRMTGQIYARDTCYIAVASFNELDGFRKITPGTKLYFPPLEK
ncbi:peptidoglycan-binding protein [Parapedobacter pyrenivorans]|uniref:Peptidoglycan-binding protein n=1 Tax=Parapedobacter pyrenivorans TaxID=1305674 RepID=A0A917M5A7_9SPHI|nr:LysM peptidoglycan-binding domain-containing protein [Parapedobacter pyrenivorans]GGG77911.1 peptidoglycan-binding protein [Parapedobacter pyrenivorans]